MKDSLEKILEKNENPAITADYTNHTNNKNSLESRLEPETKKKGKLRLFGSTLFTAGIIAATIPIVGLNSIYATIGNGIGYLIEKKKNKEKFKASDFLKELYTGAVMGLVGTAIYTGIDKVPVEEIVSPLKNVTPKYYGIVKNIAKTFVFNPGLLIPYLAFYKGFTYLRDNYKKMKQKKHETGEGMLKQTYQNGIKKDYWKGVGNLLKLFPIHYVNVNYITSVPTRIMVGVGNDILFRMFQKKEKGKSVKVQPEQAETQYNPQRNIARSYQNPSIAGSYA